MQTLGFKITGNPDGTPLALVHGWGADSSFMQPIADHYPNRRVMLIDLPGYGMSKHLHSVSNDFHATCKLLYDTVEPGCDLISWSISTLFALNVCNQQPRKVNSLVTICGTPRFPKDPNWPGMSSNIVIKAKRFLNSKRAVRMLSVFFKRQILNIDESNEADLGFGIDELFRKLNDIDRETLLAGIDLMSYTDARADLNNLSIPSMHFFGATDLIVPPGIAHIIAGREGRNAFIFPYSGHMPFLSEAKLFYQQLDKFYSCIEEHFRGNRPQA